MGIDLVSGAFQVEGSEDLWDGLLAFQGLDQDDLENYYLVAEYLACLKKFGRLEEVQKKETEIQSLLLLSQPKGRAGYFVKKRQQTSTHACR